MRVRRGLTGGLLVILVLALAVVPALNVNAAQITNRSLTLQAGTSDGGSKPGGVVKHQFTFSLPSSTSLGSIQFQYCTTASGTCTLPTGVVTTSSTLTAQTGAATGFTLVNTTNGSPYVTRTAATITPGTETIQLSTVTNPTTANQTSFVRITSFTSTNATTGTIDTGTVAASTATQIVLTGVMPESLIFCAGATISTTSGVPDCTTATAGTVSFNQLFSPTDTATATSQMAASTNALSGYTISVNGPTLTSGANTIAGITTAAFGARGTAQFGLNLKANTTLTSTTAVGAEIAAASDGVNLRGQAAAGYNTVDKFQFNTGDTVANSAYTIAGPTNPQIYTVSYIVNVPGNQLAGTYTTTLTYICTPTF